jgi:S-DNA-T family DNA segregation ATPase FtsK/SpoIIIE
MLEALPHVGAIIGADDSERILRLIRLLRETIDERALRYAAVNAGSIDEYRRISGEKAEPRILVLVDNFGGFRNAYEAGPQMALFERFLTISSDGRPVGVHIAVSADRLGAVPAALQSSIQRKMALRLAGDSEASMLDVPRGGFDDAVPPGRGYLDGTEAQVGVLGGSPDVLAQAEAIARLAESMRRAGAAEAPAIEHLPEVIAFSELPASSDGLPSFGIEDDALMPIGFEPSGAMLVTGPAGSGRTSAVLTMVAALRRTRPQLRFAWCGPNRSPLRNQQWDRSATGLDATSALASELTDLWTDPDVASRWVLVLDGLGELVGSDADYPLQDLLKVCRSNGVFVIGEGETSDVQGSWPLLQAIKASRQGIVLQPDQSDGDTLFRTMFPRVSRRDFPPGRGLYVRSGRVHRVQVAATG